MIKLTKTDTDGRYKVETDLGDFSAYRYSFMGTSGYAFGYVPESDYTLCRARTQKDLKLKIEAKLEEMRAAIYIAAALLHINLA